MSDPEPVRPWYQSQKVMVTLIAGLALLACLTVLVALGKIQIAGTLTPEAITDAVVWLVGLLVGGRAIEGAATNLGSLRKP